MGTGLQDSTLKVKAIGFWETLVPSSKPRDMPFQNIALLVFVTFRNVSCAGHLAVFMSVTSGVRRSQWPRGLRRGSRAARLLGLRVLLLPGACLPVCLSVVSVMCCQVRSSNQRAAVYPRIRPRGHRTGFTTNNINII